MTEADRQMCLIEVNEAEPNSGISSGISTSKSAKERVLTKKKNSLEVSRKNNYQLQSRF